MQDFIINAGFVSDLNSLLFKLNSLLESKLFLSNCKRLVFLNLFFPLIRHQISKVSKKICLTIYSLFRPVSGLNPNRAS